MRAMMLRGFLSLTMAAALVVSPALAKGPTVKLEITGPGLPGVLTVIEPKALEASVYGGEFIDLQKAVAEPPKNLPRYTIQFYVAPPRSEVRMMYVVEYVWDPTANRALVYLPGSPLNRSTIMRPQDGKWFYASAEWGAAIRNALPLPPG